MRGSLAALCTALQLTAMYATFLAWPEFFGSRQRLPRLAADAPERLLPRPPDVDALLAAHTYRPAAGSPSLSPPRVLACDSRATRLAGGFHLVLGGGFLSLYEHLGRCRALARSGLLPREVTGTSSGGLAAALLCGLGLAGAEGAARRLSILDIAGDASWSLLFSRGAVSPGDATRRRLESLLATARSSRLEDYQAPALRLAVFAASSGCTEFRGRGDLVHETQACFRMPVLYDVRGDFDGSWHDQSALGALRPGEPTLVSVIARQPGPELGREERAIGRPAPLRAPSTDSAHLTLVLDLPERLHEATFAFELDFCRGKLERIMTQSCAATLAWLQQPAIG